MTIRKLIVFTVPAGVDWKAALPPDCQHTTLHYDDSTGLEKAEDFEGFVERTAKLMFKAFDFDRQQEFARLARMSPESLERDRVLREIGIPPEDRENLGKIADGIAHAIIHGPSLRRPL